MVRRNRRWRAPRTPASSSWRTTTAGPRLVPPGLGHPYLVNRLAAGLSFLAGTLPEGSLRTAIEQVCTHMLERLLASDINPGTAGGPPTGGGAGGPGR